MNKEILKAIEDKQKKHPFRERWSRNNYKVMRVILFPIWIYVEISDRIKNWLYERTTWDEKRADEILQHYIPRASDWLPEKNAFWFYDNGYGWEIWSAKRFLKRKDHLFWRKFHWEIERYLIKKFELEGFKKEVLDTYGGDTEIIFKSLDK